MTPKEVLSEIKRRHQGLYLYHHATYKYNFDTNNKHLYDLLEKSLDELLSFKLENVSLMSLNDGLIEDMKGLRETFKKYDEQYTRDCKQIGLLESANIMLNYEIKRYFELFMNPKRTIQESTEMLDLFVKLSKGGNING